MNQDYWKVLIEHGRVKKGIAEGVNKKPVLSD